jgi:RNA polymerase sigma-70 factor (ECF subfamily)
LRQRDEDAFEAMVDKYQHRVFNTVYRIIGDREEAKEVAQEVFIAVFKHVDSFRGDSKFSTWLFSIATNRAKNRIKYLARRNHKQHQDIQETPESKLDDNPGAVGGRAPQPDDEAMGRELEDVLQAGIESLNETYRTVVVLRDVENLTYEEISEALDVPEGTVKSRLYRARSKLESYVDEHYEE